MVRDTYGIISWKVADGTWRYSADLGTTVRPTEVLALRDLVNCLVQKNAALEGLIEPARKALHNLQCEGLHSCHWEDLEGALAALSTETPAEKT